LVELGWTNCRASCRATCTGDESRRAKAVTKSMRSVRRYLATEGISDLFRASAVATLPQLDARRRRVSIPQERPVEPQEAKPGERERPSHLAY
jgi:hypothetical protein